MDFAEYLRFCLALGFVLVLIAILAALVRRSGLGDRLAVAKTTGERRLDLIEVRPIDSKRKLVLLRRDDREHLVLLGSSQDLLVESDIPVDPNRTSTEDAAPETEAPAGQDANLVNRMLNKMRSVGS